MVCQSLTEITIIVNWWVIVILLSTVIVMFLTSILLLWYITYTYSERICIYLYLYLYCNRLCLYWIINYIHIHISIYNITQFFIPYKVWSSSWQEAIKSYIIQRGLKRRHVKLILILKGRHLKLISPHHLKGFQWYQPWRKS